MILPDDIEAYVSAHSAPADAMLLELIETTRAATGDRAGMQISADEGALISLLTRLIGATKAIEIGTFTGYSATCIARAMGPDGRLLCLDVSEEYTAYARHAWAHAAVEDRIELRLGRALDTLAELDDGDVFDLAFIDADKEEYVDYYEALLPRMRSGGLVLVDNTLWSGRVAREPSDDDDSSTVALRRFNDTVAADDRVESFILPIRDGLTLIRVP